jgi:hypothetical protein
VGEGAGVAAGARSLLCHLQNIKGGQCFCFSLIFLTFTSLKYTCNDNTYENSTAMFKDLKTFHPGGIGTRDLQIIQGSML